MMNLLISIVIYNKKISDLTILKNLPTETIDVFIYDNSKLPQEVPVFENVNIYYEHDENNSGVSRAYNQAYKKAKELNKELLLVLDQDSNFELFFIEKYMKMYEIYKNDFLYAPIICDEKKTKIYSPSFMNNFVGKIQFFEDFNYEKTYDLNGKSVINSGLMIPLEIFEQIGGYNEKIKLDFSDVYFIEKYKKFSSKIILIDIYINHSLSGDEGKSYLKEYNRFKYFCSGAKELSLSLNKSTLKVVIRRLIRLIIKYKSFKFIKIFYYYYIKHNNI